VSKQKNIVANDMKLVNLKLLANRQSNSQGFTTVEVLVATLLTLIFTIIAMQAIVMATALKIRGQELSEATNWIQTDVESVKAIANQLSYNTTTSTYTLTPSMCTAASAAAGYAKSLQDQSAIGASNNISKTSILGNRPYILRRVTSINNVAPYSVLQVDYGVYKAADTSYASPIAKFYIEVIPGASFSCR
jgi:type II secretory pathway pseudopilin PulG